MTHNQTTMYAIRATFQNSSGLARNKEGYYFFQEKKDAEAAVNYLKETTGELVKFKVVKYEEQPEKTACSNTR